MKRILEISEQIRRFSVVQCGVFSLADLKSIIAPENKSVFYRILSELVAASILKSFCRGFYVTAEYDIRVLSQRICAKSYISFGAVLADNLIIGSVPTYRIRAVKLGPSKVYENSESRIEQFGIIPELFMGYTNIEGVNIATPEKAVLDILYYYQKGLKYSFDIYSDIDYNAFDKKVIKEYLIKYKNKKYVAFVNGLAG